MELALYKRLCAAIDENRLSKRLIEMVAIKSENPFESEACEGFREKEMGEYYAELMQTLSMDVTCKDIFPDRPNVIGLRKGKVGDYALMLAGHMDTAPSEGYPDAYDVKQIEGKIYGRGACDMKAALSVYLEVLEVIQQADLTLKGDLYIAGIMDEEHHMLGSQHIGQNGPIANQGIIGEPTDLDICPANKGQLGTIIRTFGKAVHSSKPENGNNAIVHMAKAIQAFANYNDELLTPPPHPILGHGRFSPGVIRGGTILSTVPDFCDLEVDRRLFPGESQEQVYKEYRAHLDPLKTKIPGFDYELKKSTLYNPANDISANEPVVKSTLEGYRHIMNRDTRLKAFAGATDAPHLGFPTLICGPGSLAQAHSDNEFVEIEQMVQACKLYLWVIMQLLD